MTDDSSKKTLGRSTTASQKTRLEEKEECRPELNINEEAFRSKERQLTDIIEFLPDATLAIDTTGHVIIWNKAIEKMTGIPAAEMIGKGDYAYAIPFYAEIHPILLNLVLLDDEEIANRYINVNREGDTFTAEVFCPALNNNKGAWIFTKASPLHDQAGNITGAIESMRDITEAKNANEETEKQTAELIIANKGLADLKNNLERLVKKRVAEIVIANEELTFQKEEKEKRVNELVLAEKALRSKERELTDIIEFLPDATLAIDTTGHVIIWNKAIERMTGIPAAEMIGKGDYAYTIPFYGEAHPILLNLAYPSDMIIPDRYIAVNREGDTFTAEVFCSALNNNKGAWVFAKASPLHDQVGNIIGVIESIRDITETKNAEDALRSNQRQLSDIIKFLPDATAAIDMTGHVIIWNEAIEKMTGIPAAEMIGKGDYDYVIPYYGEARPALFDLVFLSDEEIVIRYPNLIREGDALMTEVYCPALYNNKGAWIFAKASPLHDQEGNMMGAIESLRDITETKNAEAEKEKHTLELIEANNYLKTSLISFKKLTEAVIGGITIIVEKRDPYTAGHQQRVSKLACAIAKEMGWDGSFIEGIRIAGLLHDVGKIAIPIEILSKPGKLSEDEFRLIKVHPKASYDILKDIEFSRPIADIVLQHHERLDGSGYPNGLKGDEISMDARILNVSDVVEAMSSYRPYRPALGLDQALIEVQEHKGTWYDKMVVDTCTRLFTSKKFEF